MQPLGRRAWLARAAGAALAGPGVLAPWSARAARQADYPQVAPRALVFPQDHGAHLSYRTEWWYITGWLGQGDQVMGFQVTFFRSRTRHPDTNPSRFAPKQLVFAHVALAVPAIGKLLHADRAARAGPGQVHMATQDTDVRMGDWQLRREQQAVGERYVASVMHQDFGLRFQAYASRPPLARGNAGYSQKGPAPALASFYYSRPSLDVAATVRLNGRDQPMRGMAWLDHEWSSSLLMPGASGWDWMGIHLFDGGSLMAFRIRDAKGNTLWRHVDWRNLQGAVVHQSYNDGQWQPTQRWQSPRSLIAYPVAFTVTVANQVLALEPLMHDQEVDARASTGGFYWEGAVTLLRNGTPIGRGYLELTGYGDPLAL